LQRFYGSDFLYFRNFQVYAIGVRKFICKKSKRTGSKRNAVNRSIKKIGKRGTFMNVFGKMKVRTKIGSGFGTLIVLLLLVAVFAYLSMDEILKGTKKLAHEYIPEVRVANNLERHSFLTMYNIRGYSLSEDKQYLTKGRTFLENVKNDLSDAEKLAGQFVELVKLREKIDSTKKTATEYEQLVNQTEKTDDTIDTKRIVLDAAAITYMENCFTYLRKQDEKFVGEIESGAASEALLQRHLKITLVNDVIDLGNAVRLANFKSQAVRTLQIAKDAMSGFDTIRSKLEELRRITKDEIDRKLILGIETSAEEYNAALGILVVNLATLDELSIKRDHIAEKILKTARMAADAGIAHTVEIADNAKKSLKQTIRIMVGVTLLAIFIGLTVAFFITRAITGPVLKISEFMKQFGNGDLSGEVTIDATDEIGQMANDLGGSVISLRDMIKAISENTIALSEASDELSTVSNQMASSAEEMNSQADMVAAASEELSVSVGTVATTIEQSSSNVSNISAMTEEMSTVFQTIADSSRKTADNVSRMADSGGEMSIQIDTVATAVEEMTTSLNEVAKNTSKANRISQEASGQTLQINQQMEVLVASSKKIGKVVGLIKDIADQTNMLALNATIEAAGAGEAGKGFAVVAGEVKELARQSADATDEIAGQIEEIQTSIGDGVQAIEAINKVINEIAGINEMIASSVEEQTATANEISRSLATSVTSVKNVADDANESAQLVQEIAKSVDETSQSATEIARNVEELLNGVKEIARSSSEASNGVNDISRNIQEISTASRQTAISASETSQSSGRLNKIASALTGAVSRFKL